VLRLAGLDVERAGRRPARSAPAPVSPSSWALSIEHVLLRRTGAGVRSNSCGSRRRSARAARRRPTSVCSCRRIGTARGERAPSRSWPGILGRLLDAHGEPASTIRSASDTGLPNSLPGLNASEMPSSRAPCRAVRAGWPPNPSAALSRIRAPLAPPRLSEPRIGRGGSPGGAHQLGNREPGGEDILPSAPRCRPRRPARDRNRRDRILPDQLFGRHFRAEIADPRAHVAVRQLEPGAGEGVGELVRVLEEAARDLLVGRVGIAARGRWSASPGRGASSLIVRVRHRVRAGVMLGRPLVGAGRALGQFPFVAEQVPEEVVAPLASGSRSR
jgi:hypothetical protein